MKITVTLEQDGKSQQVVLNDAQYAILHEPGLEVNANGQPEKNGQVRLLLKAWSGCASYESWTSALPCDLAEQ